MDGASTIYCTQCGGPVGPLDLFCEHCGSPVVGPGTYGRGYPTARVLTRPRGSPMVPAPDPVTGVTLAGWGSRALAYLLDFFVVMIPLTALCVGTGLALSRTVHRPDGTQITGDSGWGAAVIVLEVLVVSIGYFAVCNGVWGSTFGMRPFKIGVRDNDGHRIIGPLRAGFRFGVLYLFLFAPVVGFLLIALDLLSPLWDRRRQAWHDKMTSSLVVKLPVTPPSALPSAIAG